MEDIVAGFIALTCAKDGFTLSGFIFRMAGMFYMFFCRYDWLRRVEALARLIDNVPLSARNCFLVKNFVFVIFSVEALSSGGFNLQNVGFLINVLIISDCAITYMYYAFRVPTENRLLRIDFVRQIARNWLIACCLCIQDYSKFSKLNDLTDNEFISVASGLILYFFALKKKMVLDNDSNACRPRSQWRIIRGGVHDLIVAPEQFANALKWLGFYMVCRTDITFAFFCYKLQIAFGKSILIHRQNLEIDPNYLGGKLFVCPFIINWPENNQNNLNNN